MFNIYLVYFARKDITYDVLYNMYNACRAPFFISWRLLPMTTISLKYLSRCLCTPVATQIVNEKSKREKRWVGRYVSRKVGKVKQSVLASASQ